MNIIEECVVVISRSASSADGILYPGHFMSRFFVGISQELRWLVLSKDCRRQSSCDHVKFVGPL